VARRRSSAAELLRRRIEKRAKGRCEYCHAPQHACGYRFHLEHVRPISLGGSDALVNRALACASCNLAKADRVSGVDPQTAAVVSLFNPRRQTWEHHFRWSVDDHVLLGKTATGRATIEALDFNSALRKTARALWFMAGFLP
jgi:5-methylcytosine-specific restriction endonuclease McrA